MYFFCNNACPVVQASALATTHTATVSRAHLLISYIQGSRFLLTHALLFLQPFNQLTAWEALFIQNQPLPLTANHITVFEVLHQVGQFISFTHELYGSREMPSHTCTQSKTKTSALAAARKCSIFVFCNKKKKMLYEIEAIKCTRANRVFFLATALSHALSSYCGSRSLNYSLMWPLPKGSNLYSATSSWCCWQ